MAFTAAANATQRVGNYAPGSIAARPRQFAGGVRRRDETPGQFTDRMDAGYMASAMQGGSNTPTRADNIAQARADGTFDAKRNAFNAANKGSYMDSQGNIGPKADMPAVASAPATPSTPTLTTPVAKPKTGMVAAASGGKFTSMPPGSRDLYAEEKARNQSAQQATTDKRMTALGKAASIAQSPETANIMAKAKASLAKPAKSMVAAATSPTPTPTPKGVPAPTFADRNAQERYNQAMAFLGPPSNRSSSPMTPAARPVMASQVSQDMKMAPHRALNASMSAPLPAVKQMQTGLPLADAAGPGANLNTTPLTPAEQLAESVRPGSVAAHRAVTPPSNPPPQNVTPEQQYKQDYMAAVQTGRTPMGKLQMRNAAGDYGDNADQRGRSNGLRIVGPPGNQQTTILEHDLAHLDQLNAQNPPPGKRVLAQTGKPLPPIPPQPGIIRDPIAARADGGPVQGGKMAGQAFGTSVNMAVGAAKDMASKAKNWWETGETNPKKKKSFAAAAMN